MMHRNSTINWWTVAFWVMLLFFTMAFWGGVVWLTSDVFAGNVGLGATIRWNCENFFTSPHPIPVSMTNENGSWDVLLEDGSMLYGTTHDGFMKWTLDDMWWHTDGIDVVYCESDAKALSILLAQ